ncbi:MAG: ankyrin repeat domain-containing protein, partial [Holosporales bacterium]|nr:ankyrin repeat domain-containing protein [Holosporales bacterium]
PLHTAAYKGHAGVVQVLLTAGANKDAKDHIGRTPLHLAAALGHTGVVQVLLAAGAKKDAKNKSGFTPRYYAPSSDIKRLLT